MSGPGFSQDAPLKISRLTSPVKLDGISNEAAWQQIEPLPLMMYQPTYGGEISERTEIRVGYTDHFLYFSGQFYDSEPNEIRVNSLYRDRVNGDDIFEIILDSFNDHENGLWFWINPAGVRGDIAISSDGGSTNSSWNTYWDAATVQTQEGWFAEIRIPFSSLGFQAKDETTVMGLSLRRHISRKNEDIIFPAIPSDWNFNTPSRARRIAMENIISHKPVYVTPYLLGGLGQVSVENMPGSYRFENDYSREAGLDVKYNITQNLTLDATVNTDFAQVEADNQQINLTRLSLFFPEKRQFFQERASIFSFSTAVWGSDRLFHSRRIGLQNGEVVRILGGARMVGRIGAWDVGMMNMQTDKTSFSSSENFGIFRLRRQVFNPNSYAGVMATSRIDVDGNYNYAYGTDGIFKVSGNSYLRMKWAQTLDKDIRVEKSFDFADASVFQLQWNRRSRDGISYWLAATRSGRNFQPEMGFSTRKDFTEFFWWISRHWLGGEESPFSRISPIQFFGFATLRNQDNSLESAQFEYDTDFTWKSGATLWADFELYYEDFQDTLPFPDNTFIPAGSFTYFNTEGGYNMAPGSLLRANIRYGIGSFFDGWKYEFGITPVWNLSRHFDLNLQYQVNFVRFPDRDQAFDAHLIRLRMNSAFNNKAAINAFVQYNSIADLLTPNVRFRYNFKEGSDFWIVYNEAFNTERYLPATLLPVTRDRIILVKYTTTFGL